MENSISDSVGIDLSTAMPDSPGNFHSFQNVLVSSAPVDIATLIAPLPVESFFAEQWRRQSVYVSNCAAARFDKLLPLASLDSLFAAAAPNPADWFFFRAEEFLEKSRFVDQPGQVMLNRIAALYDEGGTIHLRNIQRYAPSVDPLWRALTEHFRTQVRLNLWVTSGNSFAPFLHYDTHDIFILQLYGRKQWTLYNHNPALFVPRTTNVSLRHEDVGKPARQIIMAPGEMLYVPAGLPHEVMTCDPHSVHIAVGVHPLLWRDVLDAALADLDRRGGALANAVPAALLAAGDTNGLRAILSTMVQQSVNETSLAALQQHIDERYLKAVVPPVDGHFARELLRKSTPELIGYNSADDNSAVRADTMLKRRGNMPATIQIDRADGRAAILFPAGGEMLAPAALENILRAVANAKAPFCAADLPEDYDLASRIMVLSKLLRLGLLERAH